MNRVSIGLAAASLLVLSLLTAPSTVRAAQDPTNDLAAIYAKTDAAIDRKDIANCLSYHTANFLALDADGTVETTDQQRAKLVKLFSSFDTIDVTTHIEKCDYADKSATVLITQHIKATVVDQDSGKTVPMSGDLEARELWIKDATGWHIDVIQTLQPAMLTPDS